MTQKIQYDQNFPDTPQNRAAVDELIELTRAHYPEATFEVAAAPEDGQVVHLYATIDRVDTDELVDLVIEREMALQQDGVPIHVIPLRTPERNAEVRDQVARERAHASSECPVRLSTRRAISSPDRRRMPHRRGQAPRWCARENISTRRPSRSRHVRAEPSSRSTIGVSSTPSATWSCH